MTVIAYKDGVLAADRACCNRGMMIATTTMIWRTPHGCLVGVAGSSLDASAVKAWSDGDLPSIIAPDFNFPAMRSQDTEAMVIMPNGDCMLFCGGQNGNFPVLDRHPFIATGSGMDLALGAMAAGVSAVDATLIACRIDIHCGGGVDWLDVHGNGGRIDA